MPLAERLRTLGLKNRIGLFLHIPWPPTRLLVSLPHHERLVSSLMHYDVIGFQSNEWLDSFLNYCIKELHADVDEENGIVRYQGRTLIAKCFPIGIDCKEFAALGATQEAKDAERRIAASALGRQIAIGVDRLDYSKGLPERIDALEKLSAMDADLVQKFLFVQIAPPSREDVLSYQHIRTVLEQKTGQFNGAHSTFDKVPIRYVNQGFNRAQLFGFYRAAAIGFVTPLRDGMNLVAKEYVAAQNPENPGVLVLSRFAGAAEQLTDAILVNPHSPEEVALGLKQAMDMPLSERQTRWERLNAVVQGADVIRWADDFIQILEGELQDGSSRPESNA